MDQYNTFWATAPGAAWLSGLIYQNIFLNVAIGCGVGYWLYKEDLKRKQNDNKNTENAVQ